MSISVNNNIQEIIRACHHSLSIFIDNSSMKIVWSCRSYEQNTKVEIWKSLQRSLQSVRYKSQPLASTQAFFFFFSLKTSQLTLASDGLGWETPLDVCLCIVTHLEARFHLGSTSIPSQIGQSYTNITSEPPQWHWGCHVSSLDILILLGQIKSGWFNYQ